jgi:energy-coupling factor transporter ATP-binding protein EcfA2
MNDASGSHWRKWDLHFHTPCSFDYQKKSISAFRLVEALLSKGVAVVAVTDHHVLDAEFIEEMRAAGAGRLTVLPGIELSSNLGGGDGVHFIAIFSEQEDAKHLSNELMSKLDLATKRKDGIEENRLYVDFPEAARVIQELGGVLTIHGHGKASNYETISSRLKMKQQQKTDLLRDYIDIIEVGGLDHLPPYRETVFPAIGFSLPIVIGSDNHNVEAYSTASPCWIKADPTFAGLRMAIREPEHRFFLGPVPPALDRLAKNGTRFIKSISFSKSREMPIGEEWMQGDVPLNPGLVAVIGNKGSGKSALADSIGLLGASKSSESFSFLAPRRFCDPKTGRAQYVEATLNWCDGDPRKRTLNERVAQDEPERIKYLPQNFVETICNELATPSGGAFEQELKKVIFAKVKYADRLGKRNLDELVSFRAQEIRKSADALMTELQTFAEARASLEAVLDPAYKSGLEKRIDQRKEELRVHDAKKPAEVKNPAEGGVPPEMEAQLEALAKFKKEREKIAEEIIATEREIAAEQLRAATAKKLLDKLDILKKEVDRQTEGMLPETTFLGLASEKLISFEVSSSEVSRIQGEANSKHSVAVAKVEGPLPDGLLARLASIDEQLQATQAKLDLPFQQYHEYVEKLAAWTTTRERLVGTADIPESLRGMEVDLAGITGVPARIAKVQGEQERVAARIHECRLAEADVFATLYKPVQDFVTTHPLAKEHLRLDFRVELVQDGFVDGLLSHINQQRAGSFCGVDDGREAANALIAPVEWSNGDQVIQVIRNVVDCLHIDRRPKFGEAVVFKNQVGKGKTVADLFVWLYGLGYLKPRYQLRWDEKDISQLSPGERGTLLLIFYLLIDDSDLPLVIDQPEVNLDNLTVAQKLVHCIRDVRDRRQVIIVTHNPNLAVVCDADQIVHASIDKSDGNRITYSTGALEHPDMNRYSIDVLEGSRGPFNMRDQTYRIMDE